MHELAISSAIVEVALRHADGRKVEAVEVRIGRLRQVVPSSLEFYFEVVTASTLCEGAELRVEAVPALIGCDRCGEQWDPDPAPAHDRAELLVPIFRCPGCEGSEVSVMTGEELQVETIEVETPDPEAVGEPAS